MFIYLFYFILLMAKAPSVDSVKKHSDFFDAEFNQILWGTQIRQSVFNGWAQGN